MHGTVVLNFKRTRVGVLQGGPFACLLGVSKHEWLLFIIVKLVCTHSRCLLRNTPDSVSLKQAMWPTLWSLEAFLPWDGKNLRPCLLASVRSLPTVETINSRETYSSSVITQPFLGFEAALVRRVLPHQQLGRRGLKGFQKCGVPQQCFAGTPFMCLSSGLVLGLHINRPYSVCLKLPEPLKRACLKLFLFSSGHRDSGRSTLPSDLFHER